MGFLQDLCGNDSAVGKSESKRRQSLNLSQTQTLNESTVKHTRYMFVVQTILVCLTVFCYTGFRVSGWVEFTASADYPLNQSLGYSITGVKTNYTYTLNFVADSKCKGSDCPATTANQTISRVREEHQKWFDDTRYTNLQTITKNVGKKTVLVNEKVATFKVMPAYQRAVVTEITYHDNKKHWNGHKHGWQQTVDFRTSSWNEGTSCYSPYDEEYEKNGKRLKSLEDKTAFDSWSPSDLGDITRYYANQWKPVLGYDTVDQEYYVKYLEYDQAKCMYLFRSYFLGASGMAASLIAFFSSLVFAAMVFAHNPKKGYSPPPLNPKFRGGLLKQIGFWFGCMWFFVKKRGPQIVGFICAIATGMQGALMLVSCAQMAGFHGHWYHFTAPWYLMGIVGFLDLYAFARMSNIIHDFYIKGRRLRLHNVPEGLWARKVECGGTEGFKKEARLGMTLEKVGNEIVVTEVRGFAKTKGCLTDNEEATGMSQYYANNVQVGDVFLGIMTVATLTVREAKTEKEKEESDRILSAWDPDRLMFKEDSEFAGQTLTNQEYVMLQKPWKWRDVRSHKVYEFLQPHIDPSIDDANQMLAKAKAEANPTEEGKVAKPYWIVTWRVNEEGVKKAQFPVPTACTPEEFSLLEYKSSPFLIQHQTLDDYTKSLGLDLEDLNPTRTQEMHIETQGVVILSTDGLSQSMGLRADDVIVGVNYTPLTKAMTSTKLGAIIAEMPMPFVLNVSRKVKDFNPATMNAEKNRQREKDNAARFNKLLLLLGLLLAGFALSVTATSSTEWTVRGRDPTKLADYGIGIWFTAVARSQDRSDVFMLAFDRLMFCGAFEGSNPLSSKQYGWPARNDTSSRYYLGYTDECYTGRQYPGADAQEQRTVFDMKIMTRVTTMMAVIFGLVGVFLITLLLLVGVDAVSTKIRKRYVFWASFSSLLQAICSLIGAACWTTVHQALLEKKDNCLVERADGTVSWLPRKDGQADESLYDGTDMGMCLADFRYGPAWYALVVASIFTLLLSLDSMLSFTKYEDNLTVVEAMEIAKKKQKQKEREMKFKNTALSNVNLDKDMEQKVAESFRNVMQHANVQGLESMGEELTKQTGEAMKNIGKESLKRMESVGSIGKDIGKGSMKRMQSVGSLLRGPSQKGVVEEKA